MIIVMLAHSAKFKAPNGMDWIFYFTFFLGEMTCVTLTTGDKQKDLPNGEENRGRPRKRLLMACCHSMEGCQLVTYAQHA